MSLAESVGIQRDREMIGTMSLREIERGERAPRRPEPQLSSGRRLLWRFRSTSLGRVCVFLPAEFL